ncbi:MAG: LPP20 family lipoprotein [Alistipes sp.]|nr:LPP20 family lipoprotein [Alistipes sp.]
MKKLLSLTALVLCAFVAIGQNTAEEIRLAKAIQSDIQMEQYMWAIGTGPTKEIADKNAINSLSQLGMTQTTIIDNEFSNVNTGQDAQSTMSTKATSVGISNLALDKARVIFLAPQAGMEVALRFMTREDWDKRDEDTKIKINNYIDSAKFAFSVEDQLRYYSWANILMSGYTKGDIQIDGHHAGPMLQSKVREILNNIKVSIIAIEEDKQNKNYPYKVMLDFIYNDSPLPSITYSYFDGSGTVSDEMVKDGRAMIQMKKLPESFNINIDYIMEDLARQAEPAVVVLAPRTAPFKEATKEVFTKGFRAKSEVDTNSDKVNSVVAKQLKKQAADYAAVTEVKDDAQAPYRKIMSDIVASFSSISAVNIRPHFTDSAWSEYQKIVAEGNPTLARTPSWTFAELDSLVICREMPIKLNFKGNKKLVEDVVFRVNKKTKKIESLAYKLSQNTEKHIMAKEWNERDRLTLITFLEDYRTAYCLRDIEYINKVFSNDAYIIVGKVLQQSKKKYNDNTELINQDGKVVYTQYSKEEYLVNLKKSFMSKEFVNIRFEECNVGKGYNAKEGIYAVQVRQLYYSNNYSDDGILTLAIDMRNDVNPLVRVRVWQQERDVEYTAEQMIERTVSTEGSISSN